jgi:hypothetical protein
MMIVKGVTAPWFATLQASYTLYILLRGIAPRTLMSALTQP